MVRCGGASETANIVDTLPGVGGFNKVTKRAALWTANTCATGSRRDCPRRTPGGWPLDSGEPGGCALLPMGCHKVGKSIPWSCMVAGTVS